MTATPQSQQPPWLRGPVEGIHPLLQPVAFHVKHAIGSLDRLLTYARGQSLDDAQLATHATEKTLPAGSFTAEQIVAEFSAAIARAHEQLRATQDSDFLAERLVGRLKMRSNTIGLLFHAAEHTARHVGQVVTTAKYLSS